MLQIVGKLSTRSTRGACFSHTSIKRRGNERICPQGPRDFRGERPDYVTECALKSDST
jgi:hypothetical protein